MACVTHRLLKSIIIFLCSDAASAGGLGGLTLSIFTIPSKADAKPGARGVRQAAKP